MTDGLDRRKEGKEKREENFQTPENVFIFSTLCSIPLLFLFPPSLSGILSSTLCHFKEEKNNVVH